MTDWLKMLGIVAVSVSLSLMLVASAAAQGSDDADSRQAALAELESLGVQVEFAEEAAALQASSTRSSAPAASAQFLDGLVNLIAEGVRSQIERALRESCGLREAGLELDTISVGFGIVDVSFRPTEAVCAEFR